MRGAKSRVPLREEAELHDEQDHEGHRVQRILVGPVRRVEQRAAEAEQGGERGLRQAYGDPLLKKPAALPFIS